MNGPSQPKVVGEDWSDERVKGFLNITCYDENTDADFHVLREAYEHMVAYDFARFVGFFLDCGRNLNALNERGETILDRVSQHASHQEFADVLRKYGARLARDIVITETPENT